MANRNVFPSSWAQDKTSEVPQQAELIERLKVEKPWKCDDWNLFLNKATTAQLKSVAAANPKALTTPFSNKTTPIHILFHRKSTMFIHVKAVMKHISASDVLLQDEEGWTALHFACNRVLARAILQELVKANPKIVLIQNNDGVYPFSMLWHWFGHRHSRQIDQRTFWEAARFIATEMFRQTESCPVELGSIESKYLLDAIMSIWCSHRRHTLAVRDIIFSLNAAICYRNGTPVARTQDALGNLPLHAILKRHNLRKKHGKELIKALLATYPEAASVANKQGELPLHVLMGKLKPKHHYSKQVFQAIFEAYPMAVAVANGQGDLPLHLLLKNPNIISNVKQNTGETRSATTTANVKAESRLHAFVDSILRAYPKAATMLDAQGDLPLHALLKNPGMALGGKQCIDAIVRAYPDAASIVSNAKEEEYPLHLAIRNRIPWHGGLQRVLEANFDCIEKRDPKTGLLPFQLAVAVGGECSVENAYHLLSTRPDLLLVVVNHVHSGVSQSNKKKRPYEQMS